MIPLALIVWQAVVVICLAVDSLAVPAVIGLLHIVALFAHVLFPHLPFAVAPSFQLTWVCHAVVICGIATGTVFPLMVGASFLGSIAASFSSIGIALSLLELFQRKGLCVPLTTSVPARSKKSKKAAAKKSTAKKDTKSTAAAWGGGADHDDDDLPQSHSPGGLLSLHRKFCVFYAIVALVLAVAVEILLCADVVTPNHSDVFSPTLLTVIGNLNSLAHILILAALGVSHHHDQRSLLDRELEVVSGVLHHCAKQQVREAVTAVNEWPLGISTAMVEPLTDIVRSMQQDDPEVMGMTLTLPVGGEGDPLSDGSVSQTDGVAVVAVYLPPSIVSNVVMLLSATQGVASIAASHNGHLCFNEPVGNEAYLVMLWAPQKSRSVSDCIAAADRAARAIVRALGTNEKLRDKTGCSLVCGRVVQQRSGTRPKTTGPAVARAQAYALYGSMVNQPFLLDRISAHHATFLTTPLEALAIPCSDRPLEVLFKPTIPTDGRLQQLGGDDPVRRWMGEVQADDTGVERIMDAVLAIEDGDIGTALQLLGEHCQQFKSDDKGLMWLDRIRRDEGVVPRVISYTLSSHSTISSQLNSQQNGATVQFGGGSISQGHVTSGPLSHGEFSNPSLEADAVNEPPAAKVHGDVLPPSVFPPHS